MLELEIVEANIIEGGIEVFARAWNDNGQIGFGPDGTVDIERFKIYNPPVLVQDINGSIIRPYVIDDDPITGEKFTSFESYREDPEEALLQVIEHNLSLMVNIHGPENIIEGKRGNTTSTFYPTAGSTSPMDMDLEGGQYTDTGSNTWANAYGDDGVVTGITDKTTQQTQATLQARLRSWTNSNGWLLIYRNTMGFATSSIPDSDTISSATLSLYVTNKADNFSQSVVVDKHTPTNESDIPLTDYATARFASVDQCSRATIASISTGAYKDFALNATGIGNINKTGNSYFGLRCSGDMDNTAPTWSSNLSAQILFYSADQTGTTNDPKLVVEHTTSSVDVTASPSVLGLTMSLPASTVTAVRNVSTSASVLGLTASLPAPAVTGGSRVEPSALAMTFSIPAPNVLTPDSYHAVTAPLGLTLSIPSSTITAIRHAEVASSVLAMTFSIPAPTVSLGVAVTAEPSVLSATFSIPASVITVVSNISVTPSVLSLLLSIPTLRVIADFWEDKFPTLSDPWSDTIYNAGDNWENKY